MLTPKSLIIPGILTTDPEEFANVLEFTKDVSEAVHLDVIDNNFCDGQTLPISSWPTVSTRYSEIHLMVNNPIDYLEALADKSVTRALVHIEAKFDLAELVEKAKTHDILLGWSVNPDTDLDKLRPYYESSQFVQLMSVHPGFSGQKMIDTTVSSVAYLKRIPGQRLIVSVDGGVNLENLPELQKMGLNYAVVNSAIFRADNWLERYNDFVQVMSGAKSR